MNAGFKGYHPVVNMLFFISTVIFGMLFLHPVCLIVSFAASLAYYIRLKGRAAVHSFMCFLLPMLVIVVLINGLFNHYGITTLYTLKGGNNITFEAIAYGFVSGIMIVSIILWFFCYNEVVTTDKFMHVFGRRLPRSALVISMALRFVPMYRDRLRIIADAQRGIGQDYKTGNVITRIKNTGRILMILITWALENAIETSDSMRSRGYGLTGRKTYSRFRWNVSDTVVITLTIVLDMVIAAGGILGEMYCQYNPYIIINQEADFGKTYFINELNITVNPISMLGAATMTAYALLYFLPLIIDLKEEIKWNRLKSKI